MPLRRYIRLFIPLLLAFILVSALLYIFIIGEAGIHYSNSNSNANLTFIPPLYPGLDAYRHLDKLSYLEMGDRVEGQSTADPSGSNADNSHYLRVLPDGEHVLFDQSGPGIVTFMRMQEDYGGPWYLSLDGKFITTVGTGDLGQLAPTNEPTFAFPYPLSLNPK